ncbi:MAG: HEPN domain-containing protein [Candidatus ainarchaeum sp.]|nr:HEPN domain-containing protein [Candidatus ainarchaeum sp.]
MNVADCLGEGLLKKVQPDAEKADSSLEMAGHKLELAQKEYTGGIYENAVVSAYASMFHSARSLLFRDGYKERSHYALFVYLDEKYANRIERRYLNEFNALRLERHELMYGLDMEEEVKQAQAEDAIGIAAGFLEAVKKLKTDALPKI